MTKLGFSRYKCEKCGEYFWRHNESVKVSNTNKNGKERHEHRE